MSNTPPIADRHPILKVQDLLAKLCILVCAICLVILVATFGWLVFGRYVLNVTPTWVEQLALLLICYITFIGAGVGIYENTHLGVTMFRDAMPKTVQKLIFILTDIILAAFGAVMLIAGLELFNFGWSTLLPMLNIPESFRTLSSIFCGGLLLTFAGIRACLRISDITGRTHFIQDLEEVS